MKKGKATTINMIESHDIKNMKQDLLYLLLRYFKTTFNNLMILLRYYCKILELDIPQG